MCVGLRGRRGCTVSTLYSIDDEVDWLSSLPGAADDAHTITVCTWLAAGQHSCTVHPRFCPIKRHEEMRSSNAQCEIEFALHSISQSLSLFQWDETRWGFPTARTTWGRRWCGGASVTWRPTARRKVRHLEVVQVARLRFSSLHLHSWGWNRSGAAFTCVSSLNRRLILFMESSFKWTHFPLKWCLAEESIHPLVMAAGFSFYQRHQRATPTNELWCK